MSGVWLRLLTHPGLRPRFRNESNANKSILWKINAFKFTLIAQALLHSVQGGPSRCGCFFVHLTHSRRVCAYKCTPGQIVVKQTLLVQLLKTLHAHGQRAGANRPDCCLGFRTCEIAAHGISAHISPNKWVSCSAAPCVSEKSFSALGHQAQGRINGPIRKFPL